MLKVNFNLNATRFRGFLPIGYKNSSTNTCVMNQVQIILLFTVIYSKDKTLIGQSHKLKPWPYSLFVLSRYWAQVEYIRVWESNAYLNIGDTVYYLCVEN